jgi:uncharacterized protein involved in response to NO
MANPFRLFFPLGIIAGCLGVGHWAMWTMGYSVPDIKNLHLILQSQGFLAFFVVGFLLTAFPRFAGASSATKKEIGTAFAAALVFLAAAMKRNWMAAHLATLVVLLTIPFFALTRLRHRTKQLPPSFLLVGFGFLHAIAGVLISLATNMGESETYLYAVGRQMIHVGFLLCMVLGITAKLAPFLMGYVADPVEPGEGKMWVHGATGVLIMASFFLDPLSARAAFGVRAAIVTGHLVFFAKIFRPIVKKTATIFFFWFSCWMIPLGFWLGCFWPRYRVAALHVVFIGGFSLMIFSFGLLVVLSHSGKAALLNGKLWLLKSVGTMILWALGFRVAADMSPNHAMIFLHNASGFWVVAAGAWLLYTIPKMWGNHHEL